MSLFTPDERRAVFFLCALGVADGLVRVIRTGNHAPGSPVVAPHLTGQDIAAQAARSKRAEALAQPLEPGETVDADRASAQELERLPGVGPSLANRMVEYRGRHGPFGSLRALDSVPGIGPALLEGLRSRVRFSSGTGP